MKNHIQQTYVQRQTNVSRQTITKRQPILQRPLFQTSDTIYLTLNFQFDTKNTRFLLQLSIKIKHLKKTSIAQL